VRGRRRAGSLGAADVELFEGGVESASVDELHDVVGLAVVFADAEDRHNIGVV
jgi:hypothetical protein